MDTRLYLTFVAALATLAASALLAVLLAPIAKALVWALIIAVATVPHYRKIERRFPRHPNLAASLMMLIVVLCLILPITAVSVVTAQNAGDWLKESEQLVNSFAKAKPTTIIARIPGMNRVVSLAARAGIDIAGYAAKVVTSTSQYLLDAATDAAKNVATLLFTLAITLFILYFLYRDGERVIAAGTARVTSHRERVLYYLSETQSVTTAVVVGTIFTSLVQGGLAGLGYFVAGTPLPVLCGVLTAAAGLLPVVGTTVIWAPLVAYLAFGGDYLKATLLALWCLIVVIAITDNVIRPIAVGAKSGKIPALAVVLGAVGGVLTMGVLGLLVGPIAFALSVQVWRDLTAAPLHTRPDRRTRLDDGEV